MSAAVAVQDAIYAALIADGGFQTYRSPVTVADQRIYEVLAPAGTSLMRPDGVTPHPYVTLQALVEDDFNAFCRGGYEDRFRVRVWVPGVRQRLALTGYGHVRRILDGVNIVVSGSVTMDAACTLERVQTDPDGGATQAIALVTLWTHPV